MTRFSFIVGLMLMLAPNVQATKITTSSKRLYKHFIPTG